MNLPSEFLGELKTVLGSDTEKYISAFNEPCFRGISINRLKTSPEKLLPLLDFETKKSPFYSDGYYIPSALEGIGNSPLHHAGAFYVQEPSASSAVELLEIEKGDHVLDLCAAPGGKSAQIASLLGGSGLIWSNEPVKNRAKILLSNHERMGIPNGIVSFRYPDVLCPKLKGFFDKVLVDAPCSGEGMFRKNPDAILEWSREYVIACANRQLSILISAAECVRDGGILVYSTCTFSPEENEMTAQRFLEACPEFEPSDINEPFGRTTGLKNAVRITPLEGGEGHFAARFRKKGNAPRTVFSVPKSAKKPQKFSKDLQKLIDGFIDDIFKTAPEAAIEVFGNCVYFRPDGFPDLKGLCILRHGVFVGEIIKNRIEPAHSLFVTARPENLGRVLDLNIDDPRVNDFIKGMEIECDGDKGYTAVAVEGMILGFGKCSGGRLKNKYPKGLRHSACAPDSRSGSYIT